MSVGTSALSNESEHFNLSEFFTKVQEDLQEFNESTEGPVRDAVIETACDSLQNGHSDRATIQSDLEGHLVDKTGPVEVQVIGAAEEVLTSLREAVQSGDSGKADAVLLCYAADHPHSD